MQPKYFLAVATLVSIFALANSANACTCLPAGPPCKVMGEATTVFIGTVTGSKVVPRDQGSLKEIMSWTPRVFKFSVEKWFSAAEGTAIEVGTTTSAECGFDFVVGQRYVVYAFRPFEGVRPNTTSCSRTKLYAEAKEDLEFLNSLNLDTHGITISGDLTRELQSLKWTDSKVVGRMVDVPVIISGGEGQKEVRTDERGIYKFSGPPGRYEVTPLLPEGLMTREPKRSMYVFDHGCRYNNYLVFDNGRISGRVLDVHGRPATYLSLTLYEPDRVDQRFDYVRRADPDSQGYYSFDGLPPGRFLVALSPDRPGPLDFTGRYVRTFYPGVDDASHATVITLGPGEKIVDRDFRLPLAREERDIRVTVLWSDGKPVANAKLSYKIVGDNYSGVTHEGSANERGVFTIKGYEGQTFMVEAGLIEAGLAAGAQTQLEPVKPVRLTLGDSSADVNIIINKAQ